MNCMACSGSLGETARLSGPCAPCEAAHKKWLDERSKSGLCALCDGAAETGLTCRKCGVRSDGRFINRQSSGTCGACGDAEPLPGKHYCAQCAADDYESYHEAARQNTCVVCGEAPARSDLRCRACRRACMSGSGGDGACVYCGMPAMPGKHSCRSCHEGRDRWIDGMVGFNECCVCLTRTRHGAACVMHMHLHAVWRAASARRRAPEVVA